MQGCAKAGMYEKVENDHLLCTLPTGRKLCYPFAKLEASQWGGDMITFANGRIRLAQTAEVWPRKRLWFGQLCENITQAVCADLLIYFLQEWEAMGLKVVAHTHDDFLLEVDEDVSIDEVIEDAPALPSWCADMPFAIDWWEGERFMK
jgi:DNA polymerase